MEHKLAVTIASRSQRASRGTIKFKFVFGTANCDRGFVLNQQ